MSFDESNSILLPGSGTEGIEQLSQLSNIRTPGQWLYRIDSESIHPCTQPNLQPPYCDANSPTLINQRIAAPPPTQPIAPKRWFLFMSFSLITSLIRGPVFHSFTEKIILARGAGIVAITVR